MRKLLSAIVALAILGVAVSSYSLWQHYAPLGQAFCNLGETFSCDVVNKSAYSEVGGIPVALIGILGYAGIAGFALGATRDISAAPRLLALLLAASFGGLAFSLVLTYIEFFVIGAICLLCVTSQAVILAITILSAFAYRWRGTVATTVRACDDGGTRGVM